MKREQEVQRKLRSLETLSQAIAAMKSLAAHHFRQARAGLAAARAYRDGIDEVIAVTDLSAFAQIEAPPRLLVVSSDLGLSDGYNSRVAQKAVQRHSELQTEGAYCVGRRAVGTLQRENITVFHLYPVPSSVAGLTSSLLDLAQDLLEDYLAGQFGSLHAVSACFKGVGAFEATSTQVLPISRRKTASPIHVSPYVSPGRLATFAIREYLYVTLFGLLLDALASEHGARLVATGSAAEWLDDRIDETRRQLAAVRRESGTQDVLEVASGARNRRVALRDRWMMS